MKKEFLEKRDRELAEEWMKETEEVKNNPLSQYSTTQLKKELRRRKKQ